MALDRPRAGPTRSPPQGWRRYLGARALPGQRPAWCELPMKLRSIGWPAAVHARTCSAPSESTSGTAWTRRAKSWPKPGGSGLPAPTSSAPSSWPISTATMYCLPPHTDRRPDRRTCRPAHPGRSDRDQRQPDRPPSQRRWRSTPWGQRHAREGRPGPGPRPPGGDRDRHRRRGGRHNAPGRLIDREHRQARPQNPRCPELSLRARPHQRACRSPPCGLLRRLRPRSRPRPRRHPRRTRRRTRPASDAGRRTGSEGACVALLDQGRARGPAPVRRGVGHNRPARAERHRHCPGR